MVNSDITLSMGSLKPWVDDFTLVLERANEWLNLPECELADIQGLIRTCRDHSNLIGRVGKLIEGHQTLLHHAETRRDEILRGRGIDSLPVEVLHCIFQSACSSTQDTTPTNSSHKLWKFWADRCSPRFQIAHVNRYWREVALSIPQLWATVIISPLTSPELVSSLMQWSGSHPINIILHIDLYSLLTPEATVERVVQLSLPASARCQLFGIDCSLTGPCVLLIERLAGPTWRKLYLGETAIQYLDLRTINAPNVSILWSQNSLNLTPVLGAQLATLEFRCRLEEALPVLASCSNLHHASLDVVPSYESELEDIPLEPIFHRSLKTLHLDFGHDQSWKGILHILQRFASPSLETLSVSLRCDQTSLYHDVIKSSLNNMQGRTFGLANVNTFIYDFQRECSHTGYLTILQLLTKFNNLMQFECREVKLALLRRTFCHDVLQLVPPRLQTLVLHKSHFDESIAESSGEDRATSSAKDDSTISDADSTISGAAAAIVEMMVALNRVRDVHVVFEGVLADNERAIRQEMMRVKEKAASGVQVSTSGQFSFVIPLFKFD